MYAQREARLIFLAHPRTASLATAHALQHGHGFEKVLQHHTELERGFGTLPFKSLEGWTVFTVVRNHFDALVSWHCGGQQSPGPLGEERAQEIVDGLRGGYMPRERELWGLHRHDADVVLRYEERLEMRLRRLLALRGAGPGFELPRRNVSEGRRGRHYREFFTSSGRAWVEQHFRQELEELGYAF